MSPALLLGACQAEARRVVNEEWDAIEAVAEALARSPEPWLDEAELRRVVGRVSGEG